MIRRQLTTSLIMLSFFTILGGLLYPLGMTGLAQVFFPHQANGSLISDATGIVGSELIGQYFSGPAYFHGRPSAAGTAGGYDAAASAASNLGPTNDKLLEEIAARAQQVRGENGLSPGANVPADLVTTSASGLDPHITPGAAAIQIDRVAYARNLTRDQVLALVNASTEGRELGMLGEPRINVLQLNMKLDDLSK